MPDLASSLTSTPYRRRIPRAIVTFELCFPFLVVKDAKHERQLSVGGDMRDELTGTTEREATTILPTPSLPDGVGSEISRIDMARSQWERENAYAHGSQGFRERLPCF